jgi:hypothetical protein
MAPTHIHTFSAGKYVKGHHIATHDDRAYTNVLMECPPDDGDDDSDGGGRSVTRVVECSRDIALIYYLTKDWKREYGGVLRDEETGTDYVPIFNSAVAFRVPRRHSVSAVVKAPRPRYTIFGWYVLPGRLYDLSQPAGTGGGVGGGGGNVTGDDDGSGDDDGNIEGRAKAAKTTTSSKRAKKRQKVAS